MTSKPINAREYFEEIGALPQTSNLRSMYVIGFVISIILTIGAYLLASTAMLTEHALFISLGVLALVQFGVQLICFLHLGREAAARERLIVLGFAGVIVLILVSGSLWIMFSLDGRMMPTTAQMEQFMNSQAGL